MQSLSRNIQTSKYPLRTGQPTGAQAISSFTTSFLRLRRCLFMFFSKKKFSLVFQHHILVMHHWYNSSLKEIPFLLQYLWVKILLHCLLLYGSKNFNIKERMIFKCIFAFSETWNSFLFKAFICFIATCLSLIWWYIFWWYVV